MEKMTWTFGRCEVLETRDAGQMPADAGEWGRWDDKMRDGKEQMRWSLQMRWKYGGKDPSQDGKIVPALKQGAVVRT